MDRPTALIVSPDWGDGLSGGVPSSVRFLSKMLKSLGIEVCCTAFCVTKAMQIEAKKMGVTLIYPDPPERLRRQPMGSQWLLAHKWYFPELSRLSNVAMVIGFGMITSDAAVKIQSDLYPHAHYHHINVYSRQTPAVAVGYQEDEFQYCSDAVAAETKKANSVFSVGFQTFRDYGMYYLQFVNHVKHYQILPIPDEKFFSLPAAPTLSDQHEFNILSLLDGNDILNLTSIRSVLPQALNWTADNMDRPLQQILTWSILGVPVSQEATVSENIQPRDSLILSFQRCHTATMETEFLKSAVVLVPPSSVNNLTLTLSALAAGKPVIVPSRSDSQDFIRKFLPSFESKMVVDMQRSPVYLQEKLQDVIQNYSLYTEMASAVKIEMQNTVMEAMQDINKDFLKCANHSADCLGLPRKPITWTETDDQREAMTVVQGEMVVEHQPDTSGNVEGDTTEHQAEEGLTGNTLTENVGELERQSSLCEGMDRVLENRIPLQISIIQRVCSGVPDGDQSVGRIADKFLSLDDLKDDFTKIFQQMTNIHQDIFAECVEGNNRYILTCKSMAAAEALWEAYTTGRLDDIINESLITRKRLQKIQARFLLLECIIEHEEYSVLKEELREYEAKLASQNACAEGSDTRSVNQLNDEIGLVEEQLKQMTSHVIRLSQSVHENAGVRDALRADWLGTGTSCQRQIDEMRRACSELETRLRRNRDAGDLGQLMKAVRQKMQELDAVQTVLQEKKRTKEIGELLSSFSRLDRGLSLKDTVRLFGRQGSLPGSYNDPCGITIKDNGDFAVADSGNERVQTLDANNRCKSIIKFYGFRRKFKPQDVAVVNDTYYIADRANRQVIVCDQRSCVQALLGVRQLMSPTGLCVSKDGFVYVADYIANRVHKYRTDDGRLVAYTQEGLIAQPHSVILTRYNVLLVSGCNCIYVLATNLQVLSTFGEGFLERPMGLAADKWNNTYVCSQGKLFFFDANHQLVSSVSHSLTTSNFIAVDDTGRVVCSDSGGNCLKVLYT